MATADKKAEAPASSKPKKIRVVRYIGTADERLISREDWDNVGIDHDGAKWFKGNKWEIDASKFSDDCLNYFANDDDGFIIVDKAVDLAPAETVSNGDVIYES
jgi:hypothetical protein